MSTPPRHKAEEVLPAPAGHDRGLAAVRLGYRKELDAIADPDARRGKALITAAAFEIDDLTAPPRNSMTCVLSHGVSLHEGRDGAAPAAQRASCRTMRDRQRQRKAETWLTRRR